MSEKVRAGALQGLPKKVSKDEIWREFVNSYIEPDECSADDAETRRGRKK